MKKTSFIIGLLFFCCQFIIAQQDTAYLNNEILQNKIKVLESEIYNIKSDFVAFNNQFNSGTRLCIVGVAMICTGGYMVYGNDNTRRIVDFPVLLLFGGAAINIVGTIIQLDAYKYLGGGRSLTVGSGGISYKF